MPRWCATGDRRRLGLLTLHEAAERLGVHYMTVYRHVRLGMLPARKVGGTWRIDPVDLSSRAVGSGPAATQPFAAGQAQSRGRMRRRAPWSERLRDRMLAGDAAGSWQVVEAAMASGVEPADVYVEILAPALHGIGAGWQIRHRSRSSGSTSRVAWRRRSSAGWVRASAVAAGTSGA